MQLTRNWQGHKFKAKVPWGTSDDTFYRGNYCLSWNRALGYVCLQRFNKESWAQVWQECRDAALTCHGGLRVVGQNGLENAVARDIEYRLDQYDTDVYWDTVIFIQSHQEDLYEEMLEEIVPKSHREYVNDVSDIAHGYPIKTIKFLQKWE